MVVLVVATSKSFRKKFPYRYALKKNIRHLAGLALFRVFTWKMFILPGWNPDKIGLAHFSYEHTIFL